MVRFEKLLDPARQSRRLKANPGFVGEPYLWIDANFELRVDPDVIAENHPESVVNFRHRDRTRIKDEAAEIIRLRKCDPQRVRAQLAAYRAEGFDTDNNPMQGLSCNGMIFRRPSPAVTEFNQLLEQQLVEYSSRDQMAADYCAWRVGIELGKFPGTFDRNPYTRYFH